MRSFRWACDEALPAIVALAIVVVAQALLDGWARSAVAVGVVALMFAAFAYRERSPQGQRRREAGESFRARLDVAERTTFDRARFLPLALGIVVAALDGLDAEVFAVTSLATFLVVQALLALWLHGRRSGGPVARA